jgi:hypothetical protein
MVMREPRVRVGVWASVGEGSIEERVSGERQKSFGPCQFPTLTGVGIHHSLFGLLDFRRISDSLGASANSTVNPLQKQPVQEHPNVPAPANLCPIYRHKSISLYPIKVFSDRN